jgi:hypothetical protein
MNRNESGSAGTAVSDPQPAWTADALLLEQAKVMANSAPAEIPLKSYLDARGKLHFEAMHFPLGFPVRVLSNSADVLAAAHESWSAFHPVFHRGPLEILFDVKPGNGTSATLPPAPAHMQKESLLVQVADIDNFFIADLKQGRAMCRVTKATTASSKYFRYHFMEAAALCMLSALRAVAVHSACVRIGGKGVLLCGESGDGKSTLAFAGSRTGWTYVTDDATYVPLDRDDRLVVGNCNQVRFRPSAAEIFPELAGRAMTPRAAGKPSIEVRTSEWPDLAVANSAFVDHIVFLNRNWVDAQELVPVRMSSVWPWFSQSLLSTGESRLAQERALTRLLGAGIYELRYRDLGWAIERLNQLAVTGN